MRVTQVHPVTSENQFHFTRLLLECPGLRSAWPYLFARTAWCLGLSFFRLSSLLLCAPLGASGLLPLPAFVLVEALHVWFFFFSSLVIHILFCCLRACVKLERLHLSRQVVKLEHVRLSDCFSNEPGWATTCRCDTVHVQCNIVPWCATLMQSGIHCQIRVRLKCHEASGSESTSPKLTRLRSIPCSKPVPVFELH